MAVKTKTKKTSKKNSQADEGINIPELIALIEDSNLPEHKKLMYLITISDGSFCLQDIHDIQAELKIVGQKLEQEQQSLEDEIAEMEAEIDELQAELDQYAIDAFEEYESNVDLLIEAAHKAAEEEKSGSEASEIEKIRKKLQ